MAKKVVGVEIVEEAVEAAKENAALNGLDNCTFWAGDVLKVIDDLGEVPDLIVLDPPRDGVHPKALERSLILVWKEWFILPASRLAWQEIWSFCREEDIR